MRRFLKSLEIAAKDECASQGGCEEHDVQPGGSDAATNPVPARVAGLVSRLVGNPSSCRLAGLPSSLAPVT